MGFAKTLDPSCTLTHATKSRWGDEMFRLIRGIFAAGFAAMLMVASAQAQTKPDVTSLGPDFPKAEMFVGNSFFYFKHNPPPPPGQPRTTNTLSQQQQKTHH